MIDWIAKWTNKKPEQVCCEWHSWWIGWAEAICLFIPSRFPITKHAKDEMADEFHYFQVGRAIGFGTILFLITVLVKWIF